MKKITLIMAVLVSTQVAALSSIYDSPSIMKLIEATEYAVEAAGEFRVHENAWVDTGSNVKCRGQISAEEVLNEFIDYTEAGAEDLSKYEVAQAIVDFKTILGDRDNFTYCSASSSVPYYFINYHIYFVDDYKIAFEVAWEN